MSDGAPASGTMTDVRGGGGGAAPPTHALEVVAGLDRGRSLLLERGTYTIGTATTCSLQLSDRLVSRCHLELEVLGQGIRVRDLESKNGSYYQGARFNEVVARDGAVILLGKTELRIVERRPGAELGDRTRFHGLRGHSPATQRLYAMLEQVAASDGTVLIEGETGTGKECCAEAIHAASPRAKEPFAICDLGGIAPSLIESEFFGHRKGAFTGANDHRDGVFVHARRGTVFLDEIGELPLALQTRLLRVLDKKMVQPVGGSSYTPVDVRVIAATNRDLAAECAAGRFRTDLFHRLAVLRIAVPPLRERKGDIEELVRSFLGDRDIEVSPPTLSLLTSYDWPGNVRELQNLVTRALAFLGNKTVLLPSHFEFSPTTSTPAALASDETSFAAMKERIVAEWERTYLATLMTDTGYNVTEAARRTGMQRTYLHRLLRKHGLRKSDDA